jgi:hypothetical protein
MRFMRAILLRIARIYGEGGEGGKDAAAFEHGESLTARPGEPFHRK